ncbi:unnamed protein product, partial [Rotaria socialis]
IRNCIIDNIIII